MNERAADLGEDTPSLISSGHPYLRRLGILTICVAVLSALYHITAVYLLPLPAEQHPNMHLLLAFVIILLGGFASRPDEIGAAVERLRALPILYFLSLAAAVFFFYFITVLGEEWRDRSVRWVYAIPFAVWALMMIQERQWGALGLWLLSMVPSLFLFVFWGSLPLNVQAPQSWWLLLAVSVPVGWVLFEVFYRPGEGLRRAAVPLAALFASLGLAAWRILLWANQADGVRLIGYLWPLLPLAALIFWSKREMHRRWAGFPRHRLPASMDLGVNAGLLALGVGACIYLFYSHDTMSERVGTPNFTDTRAGFMLIFLVSELCRRSFGPPLPVLAVIAILYGLWGNLLPDPFDHGGSGWIELVAKLSTDFIGGVLGFLVVISATFIIMFLILGTFLQESGAGKFFVQFALGLFGRLRAGAALSAVGASALMGTVSGSAAGNVITTGTFTIPLMKRIGISPHIAAAAEAAASSGGQIMPPVMGAGAFIMAELIEVPYSKIILYAAIPAVLYFFTVGINIQFAAGKLQLQRLPKNEVPDWKAELLSGWFYLVPLAFLIYFLMEGRTPVFAGVMSIFIMVAIWFYRAAAEFLARLRVGDRVLSDELWVFVPITFWLFLVLIYSLALGLEPWTGLPLSLQDAALTAGSALRAALVLGVLGFILAFPFMRLAGGWPLWNEVERAGLVIHPAGAAIMVSVFGWDAGTAGISIVLALLLLWALARGYGLRPISVIPWIFAAIWAAAFGLQYGLYQLFPGLYEVAEYLRPFGFLYHSAILFAFAALIQRAVMAAAPPRSPEGADKPTIGEVAAVSCNPLLYLWYARRGGRRGPDVEAARGAAGWLDDIRRALETGGRQGAEFAVTLATIEIVVQVLSITGVGNKFAFMVEALAKDICLVGPAAGGGCLYYLGVDGFFVALVVTAAALTIMGMGMPTTAAYILLAVLGGPILVRMIGPELIPIYGEAWVKEFVAAKGDKVAAHLFIFYYAILSAVTPPVAIASLVGARLAGAPYFKTAMMSIRFAIGGFVAPFMFMFEPSLILFDHPLRVVFATFMSLVAFTCFAGGAQGWMIYEVYFYERVLLFLSFASVMFFMVFFNVPWAIFVLVTAGIPWTRQLLLWFRRREAERAATA